MNILNLQNSVQTAHLKSWVNGQKKPAQGAHTQVCKTTQIFSPHLQSWLKNSSLYSLNMEHYQSKCSQKNSPPNNRQGTLSNGSHSNEKPPKWQCPMRKRATRITPLLSTRSISKGNYSLPTLGRTSKSILPCPKPPSSVVAPTTVLCQLLKDQSSPPW